ncbi:MAG: gliding motility lipoprotein GldH [Prevotella sp.]|nr:gliding motility lipoprotein GldH [Prevotella sp.]
MRSKVCTLLYTIALMATVIGAGSCSDPRTYDHYESVPMKGWERNDTLSFNVPRQWEGLYQLDLGLRASQAFPYKEITLIMERTVINYRHRMKQEKRFQDTVRCEIINDKGMLMGKDGVSSSEIRYHITDFRLIRSDSLHITLRHVMSRDAVPGISNVGIRLTKLQ